MIGGEQTTDLEKSHTGRRTPEEKKKRNERTGTAKKERKNERTKTRRSRTVTPTRRRREEQEKRRREEEKKKKRRTRREEQEEKKKKRRTRREEEQQEKNNKRRTTRENIPEVVMKTMMLGPTQGHSSHSSPLAGVIAAGPSSRRTLTVCNCGHTLSRNMYASSTIRRNHCRMTMTTTRGHGESMVQDESKDMQAASLVSSLLDVVGTGSDGSADTSLTESQKNTVCDILESLETLGEGTRPLEDERIYGNYNVSYVSMGKKQYGQPAGGRFRTGVGRFLFRTTGLFQSVLRPDIVVNKVDLKIFGCIPCYVALRGRLVPINGLSEEESAQPDSNMQDTVKVFFNPPVLGLPFGIHATIGPKSSVVLKTTYVDERVRIGKGSRGSLFVFTRGFNADAAGMDVAGLEKTTAFGKSILAACIGGLIASGGFVFYKYSTIPHLGGIGLFTMLLGMLLAFIFSRGGIISTEDDRPLVSAPAPASS